MESLQGLRELIQFQFSGGFCFQGVLFRNIQLKGIHWSVLKAG